MKNNNELFLKENKITNKNSDIFNDEINKTNLLEEDSMSVVSRKMLHLNKVNEILEMTKKTSEQLFNSPSISKASTISKILSKQLSNDRLISEMSATVRTFSKMMSTPEYISKVYDSLRTFTNMLNSNQKLLQMSTSESSALVNDVCNIFNKQSEVLKSTIATIKESNTKYNLSALIESQKKLFSTVQTSDFNYFVINNNAFVKTGILNSEIPNEKKIHKINKNVEYMTLTIMEIGSGHVLQYVNS